MNSEMKSMQVLLRTKWGLNRPNLLISIIGGAKNLNLNPQISQDFKEGLFKVASTTGGDLKHCYISSVVKSKN